MQRTAFKSEVKKRMSFREKRSFIAMSASKLFIEKGYLLDKDMFNFLNELKGEEVANEILS